VRAASLAAAAPLAAAILLASPETPYRYVRPVQGSPGWNKLDLPDEVLDACRPGLPDARIVDGAGRDVPYAFEPESSDDSHRYAIENLETQARVETSGSIDRGGAPGFADAVTFEIEGSDFLKPVRIEASPNGMDWRDVARGSIYATKDVRMLTIPVPETDRRYLRFHLDDRNGDPVRPTAVVLRSRGADSTAAETERPVEVSPLPPEEPGVSRYAAALPAANLGIRALRFAAGDPAFSRRIRVWQRVLFRDEVLRRLLAEGVVAKSAGGAGASDRAGALPLAGADGRSLEIEVENLDSPPLDALRVAAIVRPVRIRFFAADGATLALRYGSPGVSAPRYDLGRALAGSSPATFAQAALGPVATMAAEPRAEAGPPRVALADAAKWTSRRAIVLPGSGGVAYLDFYDFPDPRALRIADAAGGQVSYLVERGAHEHARTVRFAERQDGTRTVARVDLPAHPESIVAVELASAGPDYFTRRVAVGEEQRDARGVTGVRRLGEAQWARLPGDPPPRVRLPIARPQPGTAALVVEIENGDNAPVKLAGATVFASAVRIDFAFRTGDRLFLLSGNPDAAAPHYDLELLAGTILESPAAAATLRDAETAAPERSPLPAWFWAAVVGAGALLLFQLSRTLRAAA